MTAATYLIDLVGQLAPVRQQRLAARAVSRFDVGVVGVVAAGVTAGARHGEPALRTRLFDRYGHDVLALLNACRAEDLIALAAQAGVEAAGPAALRLALWRAAVASERAGTAELAPILIGGHLVACAPARGLSPPAAAWPRPLPASRPAEPPDEEPECLDSLLDAADRALGVRLGARGRDGKGAWGQRAAELLGVVDRGDQEPDWRGDVEIKTVAVALARSGHWRVVEDPAISTVGAAPVAKLQRVLWLCRADAEPGDATLLSWYLLDWDTTVATLVERYLHVRPKGPRGSTGRGYYLHKRFFADAGLLASLNGPPRP
jgi:hypothetical protein